MIFNYEELNIIMKWADWYGNNWNDGKDDAQLFNKIREVIDNDIN